jgi:hypothetical protein
MNEIELGALGFSDQPSTIGHAPTHGGQIDPRYYCPHSADA